MKNDTEIFVKSLKKDLEKIFTTYTKDKLEVFRILNGTKDAINGKCIGDRT